MNKWAFTLGVKLAGIPQIGFQNYLPIGQTHREFAPEELEEIEREKQKSFVARII